MAVPEPVLELATRRLAAAGCIAAADEAATFVAAAPDRATLDAWLGRREQGEPAAWITGTTWFCGRSLRVDPGVYVPRPQTESLARRAGARLPPGGRALDLCTGAGAIGAHLRSCVPTAVVVGVDRDVRAAVCARRNGVPTVVADLAEAVRPRRSFDLVTAVAPYVPTADIGLLPVDVQRHEPRAALDGGSDGLDLVRRVVVAAAGVLRPGGWLAIELGGEQDVALAPVLDRHGFGSVVPWRDADGDLRGLVARWAGAG